MGAVDVHGNTAAPAPDRTPSMRPLRPLSSLFAHSTHVNGTVDQYSHVIRDDDTSSILSTDTETTEGGDTTDDELTIRPASSCCGDIEDDVESGAEELFETDGGVLTEENDEKREEDRRRRASSVDGVGDKPGSMVCENGGDRGDATPELKAQKWISEDVGMASP